MGRRGGVQVCMKQCMNGSADGRMANRPDGGHAEGRAI